MLTARARPSRKDLSLKNSSEAGRLNNSRKPSVNFDDEYKYVHADYDVKIVHDLDSYLESITTSDLPMGTDTFSSNMVTYALHKTRVTGLTSDCPGCKSISKQHNKIKICLWCYEKNRSFRTNPNQDLDNIIRRLDARPLYYKARVL